MIVTLHAKDPFHYWFSITIKIRWKFQFVPTLILLSWLLQNFVHDMVAMLSWHVQNIGAIGWSETESQQNKISIELSNLNCAWDVISDMGQRSEWDAIVIY